MQGESVGLTIPRNYFDLSQEHVFTAEAGLIYPVYSTILMPGDVIKVKNECVIRQMPTLNPSFSRFKVRFWDFAVAIRNLDKNIYRFLSGFEEYTSEIAWNQPLPKWKPTNMSKTRPGTLWDFLENPVNCIPEQKFQQVDYFRQAYGYIWDLYFRNETRQNSILKKGQPGSWDGEDLLRVNYDRDYFTTSLPKQVLGEPMGIPISGTLQAVFNRDIPLTAENLQGARGIVSARNSQVEGITINPLDISTLQTQVHSNKSILKEGTTLFVEKSTLNDNTIEIKNATSILLTQLTEMLAIESMHLINAIAGIRDDEFLSAHWGISPNNEALQYPIVFGKSEMSLITETVFQTAPDANRQGVGDMFGKGTAVGESKTNTYHAKEFCIYLKLMYIKPETIYGGQGISREKCQNTMYDFPFVELNHLAMQPIYAAELLCVSSKKPTSTDAGKTIIEGEDDTSASTYNNRVLGFTTNFSWYTEKRAKVSGLFIQEQYYHNKDVKTKQNLYNWTEARFFSIKENERPIINNDFLQCKIDNRNYQIVDDTVERAQFMVWHNNIIDSWRSMSSKRLPSMLGVTEGLK